MKIDTNPYINDHPKARTPKFTRSMSEPTLPAQETLPDRIFRTYNAYNKEEIFVNILSNGRCTRTVPKRVACLAKAILEQQPFTNDEFRILQQWNFAFIRYFLTNTWEDPIAQNKYEKKVYKDISILTTEVLSHA